ncbi:MAG: hypothetical protein LAO78_01760 [Acidobacteriia bacterium]|nr:hypothetical protein [Terriglobia bacterium]
MKTYSTRQASKMLGLSWVALAHYIKVGKVPPPQIFNIGGKNIHAWTEAEIEHVRKLLPKIANGRKTRYKKSNQQSAVSTEQSAKTKTPAKTPVPNKSRNPKKKQPSPKANAKS